MRNSIREFAIWGPAIGSSAAASDPDQFLGRVRRLVPDESRTVL
jgi:hypothetical protein